MTRRSTVLDRPRMPGLRPVVITDADRSRSGRCTDTVSMLDRFIADLQDAARFKKLT
jgi:hypothetical protein